MKIIPLGTAAGEVTGSCYSVQTKQARILVDIAIKPLSAAINDPTSAVLSTDQLQRVLRRAGRRNLRTDSVPGADGSLRVMFRTPD